MVSFSIAAVLLSALAAALILQRAAAAARRPDADPTLGVYRRQLNEIDDLAERGLIGEGELKAARAEAARRLLGAAKDAQTADTAGAPRASRALRLWILAGAVIAPVLASGLYLKLGAPGAPDQPFADRLRRWTQTDPNQLTPPQMAAVLETVVKSRPGDAEPLTFLARAQAASGNVAAAAETMRKAIRLEPRDGDLWANLGILLMLQGQGEETAPSGEAFRKAIALDPRNAPARYHLARARIAAGDVNGGLKDWRALSADLAADSAERNALDAEIAATAQAGHLISATPAREDPQQQAQAGGAPDPKAMVAQLAARLQQRPDDLPGWLRLIRSYAVLGERDKLRQALDQARGIFKDRPDALKAIDSATAAPQGSE
jgi:cytochrome c-type biogenesis protein CcmH